MKSAPGLKRKRFQSKALNERNGRFVVRIWVRLIHLQVRRLAAAITFLTHPRHSSLSNPPQDEE